MTVSFTSPTSCTTVLGNLFAFNGGFNTATVLLNPIGGVTVSTIASPGSTGQISSVPAGVTYTVSVITDCTPLTSNVTVDGITQSGNGTLIFTTTNSVANPDINCFISCS